MTRKDYELIANVLYLYVRPIELQEDCEVAALAIDLADSLALDNPRFNKAKFLFACGVSIQEGKEE